MKTAITWIVTKICNLLNPLGLLAFLLMALMCIEGGFWLPLIVPAIFGIIGLIFGIFCWDETLAPRMFWVKSRTDIFEKKVGAAIGYMLGCFNSACFLEGVIFVLIMNS